jgi:serine/threonine-protein kinase RsbW
MTELRVSYTLDSTLETVDSAEQTASRIAAETGFDEDQVMQISMAVREAAVNAVLHGNAYDPDKKVKLDFERTSSDLVITIRDQGKGLDLNKIPDPLAPENLLKTSGRGIFLIRSFMDEVQIHPSQTGTEIKLVKHVHGLPEDANKEASQ